MLLFTLLGMLAGQFLVWCADRLPVGRSLFDTSLCPTCGKTLSSDVGTARWPIVLGWRRCANEGGRVRWRSLAVLVITALGFGFLWHRYGLAPALLPYTIYWMIFVLVTVIDMEHRLILNVVIYPAIPLAIGGAFITPGLGIRRALLGGVTGLVLVFGIYLLGVVFAKAIARRRGRPLDEVAFGAGDVKLALFIGLVTGLPNVFFALVIGIFLGGLVSALYLAWRIVRRRYAAFMAIPYGPFLVAGGLTMMLYGQEIMHWYLGR